MKQTVNNRESGAVSIFLVVFFALLLGVITLSFIGIVVRDANQSTNDDLSRSAYDSANAGVEDAKRAIALYATACNTGDVSGCHDYGLALAKNDCSALVGEGSIFNTKLGLNANGKEVQVRSTSDDAFSQAYTCVNVDVKTDDYINTESSYQSDIIPLTGTGTFDGVTLSWYNHTDGGLADGDAFHGRSGSLELPPQTQWDTAATGETPSILRLELLSFPDGSPITSGGLAQDMRTIFLYPVDGGTGATVPVSFQPRDVTHATPPASSLVGVSCGGTNEYACSANVSFNGLSSAGYKMYLRVTPIYRKTTYQLKLNGVQFDGVEPLVDSTGKANDVYRRVQSRVRMQNSVLYPEFAVDVSNSFCKDFAVGSDPGDFINHCTE